MEYYTHRFEKTITPEEYESKYNFQSYAVQGEMLNAFEAEFPNMHTNGALGTFEKGDGGIKFILEVECDVSPLEVATKQVENYTNK